MQVAIPEFDGRIIGVPISFKEPIADAPFEALHYAPDLERCGRLARLAVNHARLRTLDRSEQRTGIVLSSFPTKHARIGNAVGLDTPASAMMLLAALQEAGHRVEHDFADGDELIHALIATGGHDAGVPLRPPARAGHRAALRRRLHRVVQLAAGRAHAADGRDLGPAARRALHRRRRLRDRGAGARQRAARDPAAARLRREPGRDLPRPRPRARPPLPRDLPLAVPARRRDRPPRQARHARVAAGQGARAERGLRARRLPRRHPALLSVRRQRPRRGHAGQAPRPRRRDRPPRAADDARRDVRRDGQARAAARRLRARRGARPREAARRSRTASGR